MPTTARRRATPTTPDRSPAALRWRAAQARRLVLYPPTWLRLAEAVIEAETKRSHHRRNLLTLVRALAFRARGDATTSLTRVEAADLLGIDERSVSRLRAWLDARHLLLTIEEGSTAATRGAHAAKGPDGNRGAVYLLTGPAPRVEEVPESRCGATQGLGNVTPPLSLQGERTGTHARAREASMITNEVEAERRLRRDGTRSKGTRKTDELRLAIKVADRLRSLADHEHAPHLEALVDGIGPAFLRSLLRAAGLLDVEAEAVAWAARYGPDGRLHASADVPEHPVAVLRWRFSLWGPLVARYGPEAPFVDLRAHLDRLEDLRRRRAAVEVEWSAASPMSDAVRAVLAEARRRREEARRAS